MRPLARQPAVAVALALAACASSLPAGTSGSSSTGGEPPDAGTVIQPLGAVASVSYQASCDPSFGMPIGMLLRDGGLNPSFHCARLTVSCGNHGDDDEIAEVGLVTPTGSMRGTLVTHSGGPGTAFLNGGATGYVQQLLDEGFGIAEIAWPTDWECPKQDGGACALDVTPEDSRPGLKDAACRPATVIQWIHDQAQRADGSPFVVSGEPFCGSGGSAGSGVFWFTLLHYGGWQILDYAMLTASSPFGRIDVGCDPTQSLATLQPTCNNFASPPLVTTYDDYHLPGSSSAFNQWFSTSSCDSSTSPPSAAELDLWARNSIVSTGANLDIPTPVVTWDCMDAASINVVPGGGTYVFNALHANDPGFSRFTYDCVVTGDGGNGLCSGEGVFQDQAATATAVSAFETGCVPLARDGG